LNAGGAAHRIAPGSVPVVFLAGEVPVIDLKKYEKTLTLKDGRTLTIRPMRSRDGAKLIRFLKALPLEERLTLRDDVADEKTVRKWVRALDYKQVIPLLGFVDKEIVADGSLHFSGLKWTLHVGEIRILVAPKFQQRGIGQAVVRELFALGVAAGLERITAMHMAIEGELIRELSALGFREVARVPKHVKDIHGRRHDLVILAAEVSEIWEQQERLTGEERFSTLSGQY
jgi:RimJ/RimL family protein N-acetyltransferase